MSAESLDYHPSLKEPLDLESRDSSDAFEENSLLGRRQHGHSISNTRPLAMSRMKKRTSCISTSACALFCSAVMLVASLVIWSRVAVQLRQFRCDLRPQDDFEPDLRYSSRVTFQPHHFYGGPPTNATNEMWRMLEPPGDGIVTIPKQFTKDLHPSLEDSENPNNLIYGVSMFHQLHCLNFLRLAYFDDAIKDLTPEEIPVHRDHCLNYIRQAIMCNGDSTFESVNHQGVLDGMGATHQCRDFDLIFSWAYEHRQKKNVPGYKPEEILTHSPAKQNSFDD